MGAGRGGFFRRREVETAGQEILGLSAVVAQVPESGVHDVVLRRPAILSGQSGDHENLLRQLDFRHVRDARGEPDPLDPAVHEGRDRHRLRRVRDRVSEPGRFVVMGRHVVLGAPGSGGDHTVVGVEVVECAAEIVVFVNALQKRLNAAARHDGFEFPHTSVHVGRIEGGTAHNITAKDCEFLLEIRALPGTRSSDVLAEIRGYCDSVLLPAMRAISADAAIEFEEIFDTPALDERGNVYLAQAIMPLCGHASAGRVSFGTEAGILQDIGVPTIVCGPGQIRVAHQPDEYVEIAQLDACSRFLDVLAGRLAKGELPLGH